MTGARRRRFREEQGVTFDFAPMVDVVLLLVIFFMLTSNLVARERSLPLDLPRASQTVRDSPQLPTVSVNRAGKIFLEGNAVTVTQLEQRLKALVGASNGVVALRADKRGNYGTVVQVMDAIKRAGGTRLALGTEQ